MLSFYDFAKVAFLDSQNLPLATMLAKFYRCDDSIV